MRLLTTTVLLSFACHAIAHAQSGYYNLDAGRPTRVEDASPAPRYELEVQLPSLRFERVASGVRRWRMEPKLVYGFAPFSEIEFRAPLIVVDSPEPDVPRRSGLGGVAVGALHAFGIERRLWPAVAIAGEWIAPVGALSAPIGSYSVKGIATKTFPIARAHVNVAYGTYSSKVNVCALPRAINIPPPPDCPVSVIPFDPPCDAIPGADAARTLARCGASVAARVEQQEFDVARSVGMRWMTGFGVDHAFALSSTLVSADVVAERFAGLFAKTDVSAEIGIRHQWTPQVILDVGIARHFVGLLQSNSVTMGATFGIPTPRRPTP
ncbi:MAG: hypothetical protein ABI625_05220 [bacterium]